MDKQFTIKALAAAVMFAGLASTASAVTFTVGGATLPEPLYLEEFASSVNNAHTWNYGSVGSGGGRGGFLNNDATRVSGTAGQTVQFGASDAALTSAEYNAYIASTGLGNLGSASGNGRMIQIPMVSTPVLVFAKSASNTVTSSTLASLTKVQLCGVLSGKFTNWNQLGSFSNQPITVIVRAESSGTTTLLTQYLQAACATGDTPAGMAFSGNGTFANNFPGNTLPSNFVAVNGSSGVQAALESTPEAISYLSPDPDYTPLTGAYTLSLQNHNVTSGTSVFAPTDANVQLALGDSLAPPEGTLVTNPSATGYNDASNPGNPLNWVKLVSNPTNGYPIVGTTNLVLSQCYSDGRVVGQPSATEAALRTWLADHFDTGTAAMNRITSHGFVPLPAELVLAIRQNFISGTRNTGFLQIGNGTAYCNTVAGR